MKTQSLLFTKPLKEIPRRLIYKNPNKIKIEEDVNGYECFVNVYKMFDTQTKEIVATMKAGPVVYKNKDLTIYPIKKAYKSFYISNLSSSDSGFGYGTDFINLAKAESVKTGCEGRIHLIASRILDPRRPPHLFYRKLGFKTNFPDLNNTMDFYNLFHKQLPLQYCDNVMMYMPVKGKNFNIKTSISKIIHFFKEKFTKK